MRMLQPGILGAVLLFVAIRPASAGPITFTFSGTIHSVGFDDPVDEFGIGDPITLLLTVESTTTDSTPLSATLGTYNAITAVELTLGTYSASGAAGQLLITNDDPAIGDAFQIRATSLTGPPINGVPLNASQLQLLDLRDESATVFGSDALPSVPFSLTPFLESNFASLRLRFGPAENSTFVGAQITELNGPTVPEPTSLALFGFGALGLLGLARRHRMAV